MKLFVASVTRDILKYTADFDTVSADIEDFFFEYMRVMFIETLLHRRKVGADLLVEDKLVLASQVG